MAKNVVVESVTKGGTDKAPAAVLHYIGDNGEVWKISNLAKNLSQETRDRLNKLRELGEAAKGTKVSIEIKKEGNYWNLVSVGAPIAETVAKVYKNNSYNKAEGRQTDIEKAQGQQRGNVLTNATNIVAAILTARNNAEELNIDNALSLIKDAAKELLLVSYSLETFGDAVEADNQTLQADLDDPEVTKDLGF